MGKVVGGPFGQLLWPSKRGSFGWFWERKSKVKGSDNLLLLLFFFFIETGKSLKLFVCLSFKNFG